MVTDAELILTKNAILQKVNQLLGSLCEKQQQYLALHSTTLPAEVVQSSPKISKGENYNGLPYLLLDYPRVFEQQNIFAIRTMFWWGNFFSITLHLAGDHKKMLEQKLVVSYPELKENGIYCCLNDKQWDHHFEDTNYTSIDEISNNDFEKIIREKSFIKLASKIPLQQWEEAEEFLLADFKRIINWLAG